MTPSPSGRRVRDILGEFLSTPGAGSHGDPRSGNGKGDGAPRPALTAAVRPPAPVTLPPEVERRERGRDGSPPLICLLAAGPATVVAESGLDLAEQLLVEGETVLLLDASLAPPSEAGVDRRISVALALEDDEDLSRLADEDLVVLRLDVALSCLDPSALSKLAEPDLAIACLSLEAPVNAERILALSDVVVIVLPKDVDRSYACFLVDIVAEAAPGACLSLLGGTAVARGRVRAVGERRTERHLRDLGEGGSPSAERLLRVLEAAEAWAVAGEQETLLSRMCRSLGRICGGDS